jgi:hypothetical protein
MLFATSSACPVLTVNCATASHVSRFTIQLIQLPGMSTGWRLFANECHCTADQQHQVLQLKWSPAAVLLVPWHRQYSMCERPTAVWCPQQYSAISLRLENAEAHHVAV